MALNSTLNSGQVKFGTPGAVIDSTIPSRRLFDFSDRVAELAPEESPFFVYLSKVAKVPTSDSQFRFLEDRTKVEMTDRSFLLKGATTLVAEGSSMDMVFDTSGAAYVQWLIPGMVVAIGDVDSASVPTTANVRINSVDNTSSTAQTTVNVTSISHTATQVHLIWLTTQNVPLLGHPSKKEVVLPTYGLQSLIMSMDILRYSKRLLK